MAITDVTHALKGIDFPATHKDLVAQARKNQGAKDVLKQIEAMPDRTYETMADIMKGFGESH